MGVEDGGAITSDAFARKPGRRQPCDRPDVSSARRRQDPGCRTPHRLTAGYNDHAQLFPGPTCKNHPFFALWRTRNFPYRPGSIETAQIFTLTSRSGRDRNSGFGTNGLSVSRNHVVVCELKQFLITLIF